MNHCTAAPGQQRDPLREKHVRSPLCFRLVPDLFSVNIITVMCTICFPVAYLLSSLGALTKYVVDILSYCPFRSLLFDLGAPNEHLAIYHCLMSITVVILMFFPQSANINCQDRTSIWRVSLMVASHLIRRI